MCLLVGVLTGCVTTTNAPVADPQKAVSAYTGLAAQYLKRDDLDAALRSAEKALAADSRSAEAHNMMALILQREGSRINMQKAEGHFRRAISIDADFAQVRNNYGVFLSQQNRYSEAMQQFEIAGASLGYAGRVAALENLGRTAVLANNMPVAERAFLQSLEANRNSVIAKIELVDIYLQKNDVNKAQRFYTDYVNYLGGKPQGSRSLWQGIRIAKALGDASEVKRLGELLLSEHPSSIEAVRFRNL